MKCDDIDSIEQALIEADLQWDNLTKMNMPLHNLRFWQEYYLREFFMNELRKFIANKDKPEAYLKMLENLNKSTKK